MHSKSFFTNIRFYFILFTAFFTLYSVNANASCSTCGDFVHLWDATIGNIKDLPEGFFAYNHDKTVYTSTNNTFNPKAVPNTEGDDPDFIKISKDGKWLLYSARGNGYKLFLIRTDGKHKVAVPGTTRTPSGDTPNGGIRQVIPGFYWNSPYGDEIVYTYRWGGKKIYARKVNFSDDTVTFGDERIIVNLEREGRKLTVWGFAITVSGDRVYFSCKNGSPDYTDILTVGPTFITIPNGGKGTATLDNIYKFKPLRVDKNSGGCNSAMSHDGTLCVGNVSLNTCKTSGDYINPKTNDTTHYGYISCVPENHDGFFMLPFKKETDAPVGKYEISDKYAVSMNHCPEMFWAYRDYTKMGYEGWNFSNRREFLTGFVTGSEKMWHGAWVVEWEKNIWTPLTPMDPTKEYEVESTAIYFSKETSVMDKILRKNDIAVLHGYNLTSVKKNAPFELRFSKTASDKSIISNINIYDINGKIINSNYSKIGNNIIVSSNTNKAIANGVYIAHIKTLNGVQTKRFIIK